MIKILWELVELLRSFSFQNHFPKTWTKMFWLSLHLFTILSFLIWKSNKPMSFEMRDAAWRMWMGVKDFCTEWFRKLPVCVCAKVVTTLLTKPLSLNQGPLEQWARASQLVLKNWHMPAGGFKNSYLLRASMDGAHNTRVSDAFNFSHTFWERTGRRLRRRRIQQKTKTWKLFFSSFWQTFRLLLSIKNDNIWKCKDIILLVESWFSSLNSPPLVFQHPDNFNLNKTATTKACISQCLFWLKSHFSYPHMHNFNHHFCKCCSCVYVSASVLSIIPQFPYNERPNQLPPSQVFS